MYDLGRPKEKNHNVFASFFEVKAWSDGVFKNVTGFHETSCVLFYEIITPSFTNHYFIISFKTRASPIFGIFQ